MHRYILFLFAATTTANHLGYNYQKGGQTSSIGGDGFNGNADGRQGDIDIRFGGASNAHGSGLNGFDSSITANGNNNVGFHSINNNSPLHVEFNKEFYTYSAPAENFNDHDGQQQISGYIKKNLRVIFIKAPENHGLTKAALQLAQQAAEERTAIYVLTKQADVGALANQLEAIKNSKSNKPEVHFVKYRTPEEAAQAQEIIQAQYNSLSGPTHFSNEGLAPVLNFASPSRVGHNNGYGLNGGVSGNGYLPPAV